LRCHSVCHAQENVFRCALQNCVWDENCLAFLLAIVVETGWAQPEDAAEFQRASTAQRLAEFPKTSGIISFVSTSSKTAKRFAGVTGAAAGAPGAAGAAGATGAAPDASSDFDRTQVFSAYFQASVPNAAKAHSLVARFVNDWNLDGTAIAQSGEPYSLYEFSPTHPLIAHSYFACSLCKSRSRSHVKTTGVTIRT